MCGPSLRRFRNHRQDRVQINVHAAREQPRLVDDSLGLEATFQNRPVHSSCLFAILAIGSDKARMNHEMSDNRVRTTTDRSASLHTSITSFSVGSARCSSSRRPEKLAATEWRRPDRSSRDDIRTIAEDLVEVIAHDGIGKHIDCKNMARASIRRRIQACGTKSPCLRPGQPPPARREADCPLHDVTNAHLIGRELFGSLRSGHDVKLSDRVEGLRIRQVSRSRDIR